MDRAGADPFGHLSRADHCTPIIKYPDQVIPFDSTGFSIISMNPHNPVIIIVNHYPVVFDIVDPTMFAITHGMKAVPWVWGNQLQWILLIKFGGMVTLPGRNV